MGLFYIRATGVRIFRAICSNCGAAPQLMRMARADFFLATQKLEAVDMSSSEDKLPAISKGVANTPNGIHEAVAREEWLCQRVALLKEEKEASKRHDELSRRKRALPRVKVGKKPQARNLLSTARLSQGLVRQL